MKYEACYFDFFETHGKAGKDFCEVHHLIRLSQCDGVVENKLSDLAFVYSNCHRILHLSKPISPLESLRKLLKTKNTSFANVCLLT